MQKGNLDVAIKLCNYGLNKYELEGWCVVPLTPGSQERRLEGCSKNKCTVMLDDKRQLTLLPDALNETGSRLLRDCAQALTNIRGCLILNLNRN